MINHVLRLFVLIPVFSFFTILSDPVKAAIHDVTNFEQLQTALSMSEKNGESDTINIASTTIDVPSTLIFLIYDSEKQYSLTINGGGPDATILDGATRDIAILYITYDVAVWPLDDSNVKITINGISFKNANHVSDYYGGLTVYVNLGEIEVSNCSFINNTTYSYGAGVYLYTDGNATLAGSTVSGNNSGGDEGGGAYIGAGHAEITGCTFTDNSLSSYGDGAGLYVDSSTATIIDSTFTGNTLQNYDDYGGAGIFVSADSTVIVQESVFTDNTITENGEGGGIFIDTGGDVTIADNRITQNSSGPDECGGGLSVSSGMDVEIYSNIIADNNAGGDGGGIHLFQHGTALIYNNMITGNNSIESDTQGGGLRFSGRINILTNNTITDNSSAGSGGGLYFVTSDENDALELRNNIIWNNSAGLNGNDMYINADFYNTGEGALVTIYNNDYPATDGLYIIGAGSSSFYNANIHTDPLFVDAAAADFHLSSSSPCRDEGDNTFVDQILEDFEGDDRIVNVDVDIGADEYLSQIITGDINGDEEVSLEDSILVLKILAGQDDLGTIQREADVDNSKIDLPDAIFILDRVLNGQ